MTSIDESPVYEELDYEQCLAYAVTQPVGRLAIAHGDGPPHVVPVNFLWDGTAVVFRSDGGTKLRGVRGAQVTFEVDEIDRVSRTGWSVVFKGPAYEASHWEVEHLFLPSWVPGDKTHWIRLVPTSVTGRRIRFPELPYRVDRGYL